MMYRYLLDYLKQKSKEHHLHPYVSSAIFFSPVALTFILGVLVLIPNTREFAYWLLSENNPIEILTFLLFFTASFYGLWTFGFKKYNVSRIYQVFYVCFSIILLLIALEEIAWGQWFLKFDTPEFWNAVNVQGETTLHNIEQFQGFNDVLCLIFALGGLVGVTLGINPKFNSVSASTLLLPWFLIILIHAAIDVSIDFFEVIHNVRRSIRKFTEFIELLIAGSCFIYLWLKIKELAPQKPDDSKP